MIFRVLLVSAAIVGTLAVPFHSFLHHVDFPGQKLANSTEPGEPTVASPPDDAPKILKREAEPSGVLSENASKSDSNVDASSAANVRPCHNTSAITESQAGSAGGLVVQRNVSSPEEITEKAEEAVSSLVGDSQKISHSNGVTPESSGDSSAESKVRLLRSILEQAESEEQETPRPQCRCPSGSGECSGEVCKALSLTSIGTGSPTSAAKVENQTEMEQAAPTIAVASMDPKVESTSNPSEDRSHIQRIQPRLPRSVMYTQDTHPSDSATRGFGDSSDEKSAPTREDARKQDPKQLNVDSKEPETLDDFITLPDEMVTAGSTEPTTTQVLAADAPDGFLADPLQLERYRRLYMRSVHFETGLATQNSTDARTSESDTTPTEATENVERIVRQAQVISNSQSTTAEDIQGSAVLLSSSTAGRTSINSQSPNTTKTSTDSPPNVSQKLELPEDILTDTEMNNEDKELTRTRYIHSVQEEGEGSSTSSGAGQVLGTKASLEREESLVSGGQVGKTPVEPLTKGITSDAEIQNEEHETKLVHKRLVFSKPRSTTEPAVKDVQQQTESMGTGSPEIVEANEAVRNETKTSTNGTGAESTANGTGSAESVAKGTASVNDSGAIKRAANATERSVSTVAITASRAEAPANGTDSAENATSSVANEAVRNETKVSADGGYSSATGAKSTVVRGTTSVNGAPANGTDSAESANSTTANATMSNSTAMPRNSTAPKPTVPVKLAQNGAGTKNETDTYDDHYGPAIAHKTFFHPLKEGESAGKSTTSRGEKIIKEKKQEAAKDQEERRLGKRPKTDDMPDLGPLDIRTMGGNQLDIDPVNEDEDPNRNPSNFKEAAEDSGIKTSSARHLLTPVLLLPSLAAFLFTIN